VTIHELNWMLFGILIGMLCGKFSAIAKGAIALLAMICFLIES